jgi:hypothetical protein
MAFVSLINPLLAAIIHVSSELVFMTNSARLIIDSNAIQTNLRTNSIKVTYMRSYPYVLGKFSI